MGSFTDYLENEMLDHVFGGGDYSRPVTLYIGLSTTTITDAGGNITEPSGGNYSRAAVTNNSTNFPAASSGAKSNGTKIEFSTPSAGWGEVTDFFVADASSSGNILGYGQLTIAKTINNGDPAYFDIGELDISLT